MLISVHRSTDSELPLREGCADWEHEVGSWDAGNIPSLELDTVTGLCSLGEKLIGMYMCGSGTFVYECHTSVEISKNKYRYSAKNE